MYVLLHFPSFPVPVTIGLFMSSIVCKSSKAFTPGQTLLFTLPPQSGSPDTESHRSTPSGSSIGSFCGYPPVPLPLLDPRYRAFHDLAKITGISRQLDSQRSCAHGFRLGGIGAGMLSVVSAPDTPCLLSVIAFPADKSRPDHQQRADPRREKFITSSSFAAALPK